MPMEHVVNHLRKKNRSFQRNVSDVHIIKGMDVLSDMDELQIRQCLAMMKAMKSVSVEK